MGAALTVIVAVAAVVASFAGAKAAGDGLAAWQERRRQDDREFDRLHGYTDSLGTRHPGVAERQDTTERVVAEHGERLDRLEGTARQ